MVLGLIILGICIIASGVVVMLAAKRYKMYQDLVIIEQGKLQQTVEQSNQMIKDAQEIYVQKHKELADIQQQKTKLLEEKEKAAIEAARLDE